MQPIIIFSDKRKPMKIFKNIHIEGKNKLFPSW